MVLQKLKRIEENDYLIAERYYSILAAVNNIKITNRDIQLLAFTAVRGNISYANNRKDFCVKYKTTNPTINNLVWKLKRKGMLVKDGTKVKVNPLIALNFEKDVTLEIRLIHRQTD